MKSKKSLLILFPLVFIIWGIVIYKSLATFSDDPVKIQSMSANNSKMFPIFKKDTFSLIPVNKDPFLGISYIKPKKKVFKSNSNTKKIQWPEIKYLGLVSDLEQSESIQILEVNGSQILLSKGEAALGVKVIRYKSDRVTLSYKGMNKEFKKDL